MKHYRVNKVAKPDGVVLKKKDILAANDKQALAITAGDPDCPICDVYHAGTKVGTVA